MSTLLTKVLYQLGKNMLPVAMDQVIALTEDSYWNEQRLHALHQRILREKVILQVYHNASFLAARRSTKLLEYLIEALEQEATSRRTFTTTIMPSIRGEVTTILKDAGINFLFIKGSSITHYPEGFVRQMNDMDLMVEDWDALFHAGRVLQQHGYRHDLTSEIPWISRIRLTGRPNQQMVGHLNMARYVDDVLVDLDLHTTPFLIGPTGMLTSNLWQRAGQQQTPLPTPEDKLLILIAHAANHGYFLLKDFNDVYAIVSQPVQSFDWDYVCDCIERSSLGYAASYALDHVRREYDRDCIPTYVIDRLQRQPNPIRRTAISITSTSDKRAPRWSEWTVQALHTLAFEHSCHGWAASVIKTAGYLWWVTGSAILHNGLGETIADHRLTERLLHSQKSCLFPAPRRGQQLIMVSIATILGSEVRDQLAPHLEDLLHRFADQSAIHAVGLQGLPVGEHAIFLGLGSAEAVLTPVDLFIPTRDAIFTEAEVCALEALVDALLAVTATWELAVHEGEDIATL